MRHLVVCCDGTWNTLDEAQAHVPTPTNVARLHHALAEGPDQVRYYHPGVGTGAGLVDRLRGGGLGSGLEANIKSAYAWLAATYQDGDAICLFGFSRGAYTVRSLAGMLSACGLAALPAQMPAAQRWEEVDRLYREVYRPANRPAHPSGTPQPAPYPRVPVRFLGVWDTVGALGVPDALGPLRLLDLEARHRFHDTRLNPLVQHARHAVALDETRGPFTPTLWTDADGHGVSEHVGEDRSVRQVWFPGGHGDVGGGRVQTGLSDGALAWMIEQAQECTGLTFLSHAVEQIRPEPGDVLHDDCTGFYRQLAPTPRAAPFVDQAAPSPQVHASALTRQRRPPITVGSYRPGATMVVGERATRDVYAHEPWNATGLFLTPGDYAFAATGEWLDGHRPTGPGGTRDGRSHLPPVFHLAGSFMGWWQERYRDLTDDDAAILFGAPRVDDAPWMALIGVIAATDLDAAGAQRPYRPLLIGPSAKTTVRRPGYLYAFANDAWGFYGNNRGAVTLTVERLA